MKYLGLLVFIILLAFLGINFYHLNVKRNQNMQLKSTAFANNEPIPTKYTCDGEDINPPLEISGVAENAKSLVLIVDDPDAPSGTFTHWVLFNLPPETQTIAENSSPSGAIGGISSFAKVGYGGPCPPGGIHHYIFKLYALDIILNLPNGASKQAILQQISGHILDETKLIGTYQRR